MKRVITGQPVMRISLPIVIFTNYSQLEHIAKNKAFFIPLLKKGALTNDVTEQFKLCITGMLNNLHMSTTINKPFNPILGLLLFIIFHSNRRNILVPNRWNLSQLRINLSSSTYKSVHC